jgi:hypothetical protein
MLVFTKYAVGMALCVLIYVPTFIKIGAVVQAILRFCLKFETLYIGIFDGRDFFNYAVETGSGAIIYVRSFI